MKDYIKKFNILNQNYRNINKHNKNNQTEQVL